MNDLQRKVCERAKYLASKNEGAVNRVIHGGKYDADIEAYERARAKIAKSEFAAPVEEYMGKVQEISRAKDAIKEDKRRRLLKSLSQPVEVVEDVADEVLIEQPDILPYIKQKPRSVPKPKGEAAAKKFEGREKINRSEILKYIKKNVPKRQIIDALIKHGAVVEVEVDEVPKRNKEGKKVRDEDGNVVMERVKELLPIDEELGNDLSKDELIDALDDEGPEMKDKYGFYAEKIFSKSDLLQLAGLNRRGEKVAAGSRRKIIRAKAISADLLAKMKRNYNPAPSGPDPLLAEQAKAAKGEMPVDKSNAIAAAQKGLEAYHRFRKSYSSFPEYGDIMDRKKAMSDAFKIYKRLIAKHNGDHEMSMKNLHNLMVDAAQDAGGYGVPYAKRMASLARKNSGI